MLVKAPATAARAANAAAAQQRCSLGGRPGQRDPSRSSDICLRKVRSPGVTQSGDAGRGRAHA